MRQVCSPLAIVVKQEEPLIQSTDSSTATTPTETSSERSTDHQSPISEENIDKDEEKKTYDEKHGYNKILENEGSTQDTRR